MEIKELERRHKNFYVPQFVVTVDRQDIVRDFSLAVTSVSVDMQEMAAARFSFTVANSYDWEEGEFKYTRPHAEEDREPERVDLFDLFSFGAPVTVALGYDDPGELEQRPLIHGVITELSTAFSTGGTPELTISGYDLLYWLNLGTTTRHWNDAPGGSRGLSEITDSNAVAQVARLNRLRTSVEPTSPVKRSIAQDQESDLAFIEKLTKRNDDYTFHIVQSPEGPVFEFKRRNRSDQADVELAWGTGLLGFTPEAKLGGQISAVELYSADQNGGERIVGTATRADLAAAKADETNAAEAVVGANVPLGDGTVFRLRTEVHSQEEAKARAVGILEDKAQDFVTGSGESIGIPEIRPDSVIKLDGLGRGFSKTYYVSGAVHTIDSGGYKTSFTVQEQSLDHRMETVPR